jgi:hypothetical protein
VLHPEWLANPVLVLKKNKVDWRMCVDYTDLNKHCPKDPFGLPRIDQVVDSTAGCSMLSFLDCYSGYHQISLAKEDEEKTAFITPFGAFCYTSMSFGLKNAGATYQRAIQTCLADHWGKRVEAYVDDVCWNLLSVARRPTRVNSDDNRVTRKKAIALLIWPPTGTMWGYL